MWPSQKRNTIALTKRGQEGRVQTAVTDLIPFPYHKVERDFYSLQNKNHNKQIRVYISIIVLCLNEGM